MSWSDGVLRVGQSPVVGTALLLEFAPEDFYPVLGVSLSSGFGNMAAWYITNSQSEALQRLCAVRFRFTWDASRVASLCLTESVFVVICTGASHELKHARITRGVTAFISVHVSRSRSQANRNVTTPGSRQHVLLFQPRRFAPSRRAR